MRTTLDLSSEILRLAKKKAADDRVPLKRVVEVALRRYLTGTPRRTGYRLRWRTESGTLQPGVDLEDRQSLFDRMGGRR
jgi:hypothetical protein